MKCVRLSLTVFLLVVAFSLATSTANAQSKTLWSDSLRTMAAEVQERSLQFLLDSLGYDIDVANDELGLEVFCGLPGVNSATMVIEVAGSSVYATSGYYKAGNPGVLYQLFGPTSSPGDSVQFSLTSSDSIGFYMKPNLPGDNYLWLTQTNLNSDHFDHAWVFSAGVPHQYLV